MSVGAGLLRRMTSTQSERAELFHALHQDRILILPNAWDAASAAVIEHAGATAIATTSAGVAWSLGKPDGDQLPRDLAVAAIARIVAVVGVPVTADIEGGFAVEPAGVAETIRLVIEAGAVGVNLEDGDHSGAAPLLPVEVHAGRIAAAREAADATGVRLFLNARTDVYLRGVGEPAGRLPETLARAQAYLAAGADGVFVPGVGDADTITTLVREIDAPLNVMAGPGSLPVPKLADLGVARVSVGPSITEAAYALTRRAATELLTDGGYGSMSDLLSYGELNSLVAR
jgi:2-methylisocitrate lyase-like PEP mutase family enzyme